MRVITACCTQMFDQLSYECDRHVREDCPDVLVVQRDDGAYGLPVRDGGTTIVEISHCPWCGSRLNAP